MCIGTSRSKFHGVLRNLRECSSPEVSCLLPKRCHIHWKNKSSFGLKYELGRQLSDGFNNLFPLIVWLGWLLSEQVKVLHFNSRSRHVGFFYIPLERVLTTDTMRRWRTAVLTT
ncbi:uncharacterized protein EURHEDRAFT_339863 [Aspergillus ruber CBS 135680]|uniref:Uncharacterized protein n=1 Tax=Aspergillus ruber (strain CBS 135680) TaxID=1388766 RepID=A0A017SIM3_ASPRC|nr:uncharacterized protein EURHEDRAFT_339863 [Aspergillus ruber CBS 135680]EYE96817.1 hypothetical protein EURHEDRAFT_339863 [Aspergillus ruber CBS 135680]